MLKPEHQFLLPQVVALTHRLHAAFSGTVGIHHSRFRVLFLLHVMGEATPTAIQKQTVMDPAALTRTLKDFEAQGMIERRTDPADARQTLLKLTQDGRREIRRLLPLRDAFVVQALEGLSPDALAVFEQSMARVEANLSALAGLPPAGATLNIDPSRPAD